MTPPRYLTKQGLTTDNRSAENAENMHDEIHALRKALRDMTAWNERLHEEIKQLKAQMLEDAKFTELITRTQRRGGCF